MKSRDCLQSTTIFSAVVSSRFVGLKIFKYNFYNPRQASPFLTIPSRSWFIFHILLFSYLNEMIFCGFHHAKSNYAQQVLGLRFLNLKFLILVNFLYPSHFISLMIFFSYKVVFIFYWTNICDFLHAKTSWFSPKLRDVLLTHGYTYLLDTYFHTGFCIPPTEIACQ